MIAFPSCDSLFIDAHLLVAKTEPSSPEQRRTENQLMLQVLAADAPTQDEDAQLARLEAKQDLLLYLLLKQHLPSAPVSCLCRCSLGEIFILDTSPNTLDVAEFQLFLQAPFVLRLQAHRREQNNTHTLWQANIQDHGDEKMQDAWAKWLFQQHRHAIQQKTNPRQTPADNLDF